jgi:hypothetical protein
MIDEEACEIRIREAERTSVTLEKLGRDVHNSGQLFLVVSMALLPILASGFYMAFQSKGQLDITSERVAQIQKTIDLNQIAVHKQLESLALKDREIESRLLMIEMKKK